MTIQIFKPIWLNKLANLLSLKQFELLKSIVYKN